MVKPGFTAVLRFELASTATRLHSTARGSRDRGYPGFACARIGIRQRRYTEPRAVGGVTLSAYPIRGSPNLE